MKSFREKQRALREDVILEAAYQLLLEQGYQKMNMDELAARVGVAKMTIYQHFSSKEALAIGVIVRGMKMIEAELTPEFESTASALERLETILRKSLERRAAMRRINIELAPVVVLQNPIYQAQRERLATQWSQLIEQAKAEGSIDATLSTPVLVRMLFQVFHTDFDDLLKSDIIDAEELAHTLITVAIKGMRT
ncbi:TetR family transcriptional regulator [Dictyobacter vulcani]|uniref:TetR family transcriptional regulator n=1 Tax=Dictyobacter vulcani TaxID=2607529 RepID=A0A5J4KZ78_9CHLR|nr:TetR/AcrR family transcriptional regulator [Dictyobacter vulcani]GER91419.1 TetR family transcriptional regulator [Dictyobacter vulcani]